MVGLERDRGGNQFYVHLDDSTSIVARTVVVASGLGACAHLPQEIVSRLPIDRFRHTRDFGSPDAFRGKRLAIVGGRQSAFEFAALAAEAGAKMVHLIYRHPPPAFARADWSWTAPLLDKIEAQPDWHGSLSEAARKQISTHMYVIGRLQLEPWLAPRTQALNIYQWNECTVASARELSDGALGVRLSNDTTVEVDEIILATGYRTDFRRLAYLDEELIGCIEHTDGLPVLGADFESSLAGLFFTNAYASGSFGHFFDFTAGVRVSARIIGRTLTRRFS